ncbi:MAG TPA: YceI family protein [Acidimicrobiales bacterium]|nr:YceI family protein [Acidimicrobiales bacterium]
MTDTATTTVTRSVQGAEVPTPGTFEIDPSHSEVGFTVRHLGLSKVRGRFGAFFGTVVVADDPTDSSVEAEIDLASVDTRDEGRDTHLRSADFFDAEVHPAMTFRSRRVSAAAGGWRVEGDLTIKGVSQPVILDTTFEGAISADPWGSARIAFTAEAEIDREAFGLTWNQALETGGVLVGRKVKVQLEIQAVRTA